MTEPTLSKTNFLTWRQQQLLRIEDLLSQLVGQDAPDSLCQSMRYAVLGNGKRLRPLLVLATSHAFGIDSDLSLRAACAVELIHAYSLVHDDMPCMDDDELRRGKPTVHVKFGEDKALLAGDALQALAFEILTPETSEQQQAVLQAKLCRTLALAVGCRGMAGGQAIDLENIQQILTEQQLQQMHRLKTGALIHASVMMGLAFAQPINANWQQSLNDFAWAIGLAFQVVDDILDETSSANVLGKTIGKDKAAGKPTYVSIMGLAAAKIYAQQLLDQALADLAKIDGIDTTHLQELAYFAVARKN